MEKYIPKQSVKPGRIQAVIFDLDGTLVDSEPNYLKADSRLFSEYGIAFNVEMKEKYVGFGCKQMMEAVKEDYQLEASAEELLAKKNQYYLEIARSNTAVFPQMKVFLDLLQKEGYPMALASGSSPEVIDAVLEVAGLRSYFDVVISSEEVQRCKPAPDVFIEAANRLQVPYENCLVVEDSQYGVEAAWSASMYCVGLPCSLNGEIHESFRKAQLLLEKGVAEFSAEKVFAWMKNIQ